MSAITLQKWKIRIGRYLLGKKFQKIFAGPLKGFYWSISSNYDFMTGTYEDPKTLSTFISWLKENTVFYDLGANIGYYSFTASTIISTGKIIAFEPVKEHINIFEEHKKLNKNKFHPVISIIPVAVSDKEGTVSFSASATEGSSYLKEGELKTDVPGITIDGWVNSGNPPPDVLKIDVEGAEYDVLLGAANTIKKYRPKILIATHDCHLPGVQNKCIDLLRSWNYSLEHTGGYNKNHPGLDDFIAIP